MEISLKQLKTTNNYSEYRLLSLQEKQKRIDKAQQQQIYRKPNPQGIFQFHELNFIDYFVFEKEKKIRLATYRHDPSPDTIPKGVIFMFHGLNSHVGHGAHLAEIFSKHGFVTVGYDYRGFGRSEGKGGYVQSFDKHLEQALSFVKMVSKMYEDLPKYVLGLSMGGMTAYHLSLKHPELFQGAILMAPALMHNFSGGTLKVAKVIGKILPNSTRLFKPIYGKAVRNPQITQDVQKDPYAYSQRASLATMDMLVHAMDQSPKTFKQYQVPFMIIQGGLDKLVNPQVAFQLYDNSKTKKQDKQLLFYENMWHDIWHEDEIFEIMEKICAWIQHRINKNSSKQQQQQYPFKKNGEEQNLKDQHLKKVEEKYPIIVSIPFTVEEISQSDMKNK